MIKTSNGEIEDGKVVPTCFFFPFLSLSLSLSLFVSLRSLRLFSHTRTRSLGFIPLLSHKKTHLSHGTSSLPLPFRPFFRNASLTLAPVFGPSQASHDSTEAQALLDKVTAAATLVRELKGAKVRKNTKEDRASSLFLFFLLRRS